MKVKRATREYEEWLAKQLTIVPADLKQKHRNMASDPFIFLRATFYRWAQVYPKVCKSLMDAPVVLAVGDLHIENFGTWRDSEGRLIWGVNDFDEVYPMPYTIDLVRLATSANLAIASNHLSVSFQDACTALLDGYQQGLSKGGRPFVLGEEHTELRKMAKGIPREPVHFWQRMDEQVHEVERSSVPTEALVALEQSLAERGAVKFDLAKRIAGQGSLGRQRFVALAVWQGGRIARETKTLAPSAWLWAHPEEKGPTRILYADMLQTAVRCPDPCAIVEGRWVVRRLAPDCSRIELTALPQERDERLLLNAMGFELANVHLGTQGAARVILRDLKKRRKSWLFRAAMDMTVATQADWKVWREKYIEHEE